MGRGQTTLERRRKIKHKMIEHRFDYTADRRLRNRKTDELESLFWIRQPEIRNPLMMYKSNWLTYFQKKRGIRK